MTHDNIDKIACCKVKLNWTRGLLLVFANKVFLVFDNIEGRGQKVPFYKNGNLGLKMHFKSI